MKIRSLLLGSAAIAAVAGLSTAGYAADLGVVTSLDVCDELGLSGLTISSDDNCLQITGDVKFEYDWGNYTPGRIYGKFVNTNNGNSYTVFAPGIHPAQSNGGDVDAWLKFVGTASSDFGPASATIKLVTNNSTGTRDWSVGINEAWVGIGDTTRLMAGYKSSIFNKGDDVPLNYLGLFNSDSVNKGVGWNNNKGNTFAKTGGDVIQVVSNLGNGLQVGGGLENLGGAGTQFGEMTGVGVIQYSGDNITAHVSAAYGPGNTGTGYSKSTGFSALGWKIHAGFTGSWDPISVVGAIAADQTGYWDALGSVAAKFDMFTLAASGEATSAGEWGVGGSATAKVSDGVTLNLGGRYFHGVTDQSGATGNPYNVYQVEAGLSAAVTQSVTLTGAVGITDSDILVTTGGATPLAFYGKAGVAWAPGGGFTSGANVTVTSLGGYKAVFTAEKSIK